MRAVRAPEGSAWQILPAGHLVHFEPSFLKLSVGRTTPFYLLEIECLFTQGWRPGRNFGEWVGGIFEMGSSQVLIGRTGISSDWSNGIRYHAFDTRSDTEFKFTGII